MSVHRFPGPGGLAVKPIHDQAGDRLTHIVLEALGTVATPMMRDAILREALDRARRNRVPTSLNALRELIDSHLVGALAEAVGLRVAEQVIDQLHDVLDVLAADEEISQVRPTGRMPAPPRPPRDGLDTRKHTRPGEGAAAGMEAGHDARDDDHPTLPSGALVPVVLLASRDRQTLHELREGLTGGLEVIGVDDPIALLDALQTMPCLAAVVVDVRHPSVQPATMAAMAPDLPEGVQVVLWGITAAMEAEINGLSQGTMRWVGCDAATPAEEVAFLCVTLLRDLA